MTRVVAIGAIAGLLIAGSAVAQVVVDTCGQELADDGILTADLDCSAAPLPSVIFTVISW